MGKISLKNTLFCASFCIVVRYKMILSFKIEMVYYLSNMTFHPKKYFQNHLQNMDGCLDTVLQKLSKCEGKAWLCWNLTILLPLRFCVKSNFGEFKRSKNVIFDNFRDSELRILVNFGLESCSKSIKIKIQNLKNCQNDIFGPFDFAKIWSHVKSEWR